MSLPTDSIEIIPNLLYFINCDLNRGLPSSHSPWIPFTCDESLVYTSFFADFGPLDLGLTYKFCLQLQDALQLSKEQRKLGVVFFSGKHEHKRSNSAVCLMAYLILKLNMSVEQAYKPFIGMKHPFYPFRDAGFCINTFPITVLDVARGIYKAKSLGHVNFNVFSLSNFQSLAKLQNGDISWIIPGKFIGFSGPITKRRQVSPGVFTLLPEQYVPIFKNLGVTCVVRFNDKQYDRKVFLNNGIRHIDLFYEDGGNPTDSILQAFLQVCENEKGAIAVHCKAGLGRTGTNIAAYMMKHYGYTAKEAIAWCRLCRPGSVVGPQQQYLQVLEKRMHLEGEKYREEHRITLPKSSLASWESVSGISLPSTPTPSSTSSSPSPSLLPAATRTNASEVVVRSSSRQNSASSRSQHSTTVNENDVTNKRGETGDKSLNKIILPKFSRFEESSPNAAGMLSPIKKSSGNSLTSSGANFSSWSAGVPTKSVRPHTSHKSGSNLYDTNSGNVKEKSPYLPQHTRSISTPRSNAGNGAVTESIAISGLQLVETSHKDSAKVGSIDASLQGNFTSTRPIDRPKTSAASIRIYNKDSYNPPR